MKKLFLLMLPFLMLFTPNETLKDGIYSNTNELIYGIEIFNNSSEIKFYYRYEENDKTMDWKTFKIGKIVQDKNKFYIEGLNTDNFFPNKSKKLELKMNKNGFEFKSFDLLQNFFPTVTIYSDRLKYQSNPEIKN